MSGSDDKWNQRKSAFNEIYELTVVKNINAGKYVFSCFDEHFLHKNSNVFGVYLFLSLFVRHLTITCLFKVHMYCIQEMVVIVRKNTAGIAYVSMEKITSWY